jgi:LL-diaminopimelate aminotransferase
MRFSKKLERIPPYLFAEIDRKIAEKEAAGVDVISFGVGDPDEPTPASLVDLMAVECAKPEHHRYPSYFGLPVFRETIARWFEGRFGVALDPEREVLPLIGSKEGIAHLALAVLDCGETALVPEPGYPVYAMGSLLADARPYWLPLREENAFLPDFDEVPRAVLEESKILWLNYPNNPTGAVAGREFFAGAVGFARENDLLLAHDNAYSEITFDGFTAPSILEIDGARECALEFHSLSKTFNMTGWRVGFACGNADAIEALGVVKTNIDSGIFTPIQLTGARALDQEHSVSARMTELYQMRRDMLVRELSSLGWKVTPPRGSIYIWMPVPDGFDSVGFSKHVLDTAGVFFTPGNAYGPSGEGYVRISLTVALERIVEAVDRLKAVF